MYPNQQITVAHKKHKLEGQMRHIMNTLPCIYLRLSTKIYISRIISDSEQLRKFIMLFNN